MPREEHRGRYRRRKALGFALALLVLAAWFVARRWGPRESPPSPSPITTLPVPPPRYAAAPSAPTAAAIPSSPTLPIARADDIDEGRLFQGLHFKPAGGERALPGGSYEQSYSSPVAPHLKVILEEEGRRVRRLSLDFVPKFETRENDFLSLSLALDETLGKLVAPQGSPDYREAGKFVMDHLKEGSSGEAVFGDRIVRVDSTSVGGGRISVRRR